MNAPPNLRILATLLALVVVSALGGGFLGARLGREQMRQRFDPQTWNEYAMRTLDQRLRLSPEQRTRIQSAIDHAVLEMKRVHRETVERTVAIVDRMLDDIGRELTPEQRQRAEALAPRRDELTIDLLKVQPKP